MSLSSKKNLPISDRDHGGGVDAARESFGGDRSDWLDLSTGINPVAYPITSESWDDTWTALPDRSALQQLLDAARQFWNVPANAGVLAAPGASSLIAQIPFLAKPGRVDIPTPTYNEHAASFLFAGWSIDDHAPDAKVIVHPNNPDGRLWQLSDLTAPLTIIDESFCDVAPSDSMIQASGVSGRIVLKSFGKFWGLAGLRLGFAIGDPDLVAQLAARLGPWAVSGPAMRIGTRALQDHNWATATRQRLLNESARLDTLMQHHAARLVGGTTLFRLYEVVDAKALQDRLARNHIWTRIFPYSDRLIRLGLPAPTQWHRLEAAL